MKIIYLGQDGLAPSGVTSYGIELLDMFPEASMVLLNASRSPSVKHQKRIFCMDMSISHNHEKVAEFLCRQIEEAHEKVFLLPNTGDTTWSATVRALEKLSTRSLANLRVGAIVHSDHKNQYEIAVQLSDIVGAFAGVSERCASQLALRLDQPHTRIHLLRYPIPSWRIKRRNRSSERIRLLYAGRLEEEQKQVSMLASILLMLHKEHVPFTATIAGDGPERCNLQKTLEGVREVIFTGKVPRNEIPRLLGCHDVFLLTSNFEGTPLSLIEAMHAGLCPVVMRVESGIGELIEDGVNGRIVSQGDTGGMVSALIQLARKSSILEKLGGEAQSMVKYACGRELHRERFLKFKSAAFDSAAPINLKTKSRNRTTIAIKSLITELQTRQSIESVAVYGAGMFGRKLVDACREAKIAVRFLYDRDPVKVGKSYDGLVCKPADEVVNAYNSTFLIGSADFAKQISIDIRTAFETAGLSNPKIIAYKEI